MEGTKEELLKQFEQIEFLSMEEIEQLDFDELALYLQWLNTLKETHNEIQKEV